MSAETLDKQLTALREGDEVIAGMLSELDANLRAWVSAMRAGQDKVLAGLCRIDCDLTGPESGGAQTPQADASEPSPSEAQPQPPDAAPETATSPGGMFRISIKPSPAPVEAEPTEADPGADSAESPPDSAERDEALLAELDSETANLIRVRRRLSGTRRSVREILAEIEAERGKKNGKSR